MFSHHEAGIPTIRQLKLIEKVKKLVDQNVENFNENSLSLFIALFPVRVTWAAQLEIKRPHFTVFHHPHHFAWVKPQGIPPKILNVILIHLQ